MAGGTKVPISSAKCPLLQMYLPSQIFFVSPFREVTGVHLENEGRVNSGKVRA